ncbi:hypothetical protein GPA22_22115 [Aromatoleum toluvorans]|uniref:Uncharacterized protein n=1 Tax=Aromatoleum toluvorans TaxID=92002 RepID=A0ABX1Q6B3_9RHOO|nr:hypothetical protein [Aromatoleum toluvorans]NMG46417.1 hypothetical protein [Aromatoleum toluvorans]
MTNINSASVDAALRQVRGTVAGLRQKVAAADARMQQIAQDINALKEAPISFEDWSKYLKDYIQRRGANWPDSVFMMKVSSGESRFPGDPLIGVGAREWREFEGGTSPLFGAEAYLSKITEGDVFSALCAVAPKLVHARLVSSLKARGTRFGTDLLPVPQRKLLVAKLELEHKTLETQRAGLQAEIDELVTGLGL